jgi:unsaturated rhamnogalacturonyl hydrolase
MQKRMIGIAIITALIPYAVSTLPAHGQEALNDKSVVVGDAPSSAEPLATNISPTLKADTIEAAMRKVGDWQIRRVAETPSRDWTFATLYIGMLAASKTLKDPEYHDAVLKVADHYGWALGPRQSHADDQAIGEVYLRLHAEHPDPRRITPLRNQFDTIMEIPDDPATPVWWWCDALFMAPPVWAGLSDATKDPKYLAYMDREWHITSRALWDPKEQLFYRDKNYLPKREKNGRKVFWSRGNGWVMGGLIGVLEHMADDDPRRPFYVEKLRRMADTIAKIQGKDGLWRAGLLDEASYPNPEVSGSAFFIYAIAWGIHHGLLDRNRFRPVVERGWGGLIQHIYSDGRLGDIQPVGEAPGAYPPTASYVFGVGSFLLAGSELDSWVRSSR